jgi:hypothetical protein
MSESLTIEQLENKMRPGQCSQGGFLGLNESLEVVIAQDEQTLEKFRISHEQIAGALEKVIAAVDEQEKALPFDKFREKQTDFPDLYHPEKNPLFSKDNLPDLNIGYLVDCFQVFILQYRGFQVCPWDDCGEVGGFDFMILNRNTGESFTAPALVVHLIRAHHFFEGVDSPYRVDPEKVIRTLEISQTQNAG